MPEPENVTVGDLKGDVFALARASRNATVCGSVRLSSARIWKLQRHFFGLSSKQSFILGIAGLHHPNGIGGSTGGLVEIVALHVIADRPIVKRCFSHLWEVQSMIA